MNLTPPQPSAPLKAPHIPKVSAFKMPKMPGVTKMPSIKSAGIPKLPAAPMKMKVNLGGYQKNNKKLVMKKIIGGIKLK